MWRGVSFQQHFTTVTCWHFISTYFLSANFAVIFLVLTSSLRRHSSAVKRTVLTHCHHRERRAASYCCSRRRRRRRRERRAAAGWKVRLHRSQARARLRSLIKSALPVSAWCPHRATSDGQALHLVYLTSCVWHSVYASVSLSNTPSEVSLICSWSLPAPSPRFHVRTEKVANASPGW